MGGFSPSSAPLHTCAPLPSLTFTMLGLKWSTFYGRFLGVGQGTFRNATTGRQFPAYLFSLSDDLISWDEPQLIRAKAETVAGQTVDNNYASVLDPNSRDANFNDV